MTKYLEYTVVMVSVSSILTTTLIIKINNMFKVNENDIFAKNMSQQELHQTWVKMKEKQESDEWFDQLEKEYNEVQENKYY